jgi:hypothetical protein
MKSSQCRTSAESSADLDHPRNRSPEVTEESAERADFLFLERIRAVLRQTPFGLAARQPLRAGRDLLKELLNVDLLGLPGIDAG